MPPRRNADAARQKSMRLSLVLIGLAAGLAVGVTSWLGFLNDRTDSKLEIKSVEISETRSEIDRRPLSQLIAIRTPL